MTKIDAPGIYEMPADDYHADPCKVPSLSASIANTLLHRSPLHAWTKHPRLNPEFEPVEKAIFDLGRAAHNMVLRQDFWREEIAIIDAADWKTKAAREERDAARYVGLYPLLDAQYQRIERMVSVLEAHPQASKAFQNGKPEQTLIWQDEETGVWCRCRPDWTPDQDFSEVESSLPYPDYKTTADARPGDWDRRYLLDHGGLLRAGWYRAGIRAVCEVADPTLYCVVQEVDPPHSVAVRVFDQEHLGPLADAMVAKALATWAVCLEKGEWPSYELTGTLALPKWAEDRLEYEYASFRPRSKAEEEFVQF